MARTAFERLRVAGVQTLGTVVNELGGDGSHAGRKSVARDATLELGVGLRNFGSHTPRNSSSAKFADLHSISNFYSASDIVLI